MLDIKGVDAMFALMRTVFNENEILKEQDIAIIQSNMKDIYSVSKRSDMAHLVGFALKKAGLLSKDDELFFKFEKQQYLAIYRYEGMKYEIDGICRVLEDSGVDFILLKGAEMRSFYPEPWMRTSCDIDVLIKAHDLDRATECLVNGLGYSLGLEGTHDRSLISSGGVHIELHFDLVEDGRANSASEVLAEVWNHTYVKDGHKYMHELCDGMFYFYHIAHMAKHIEEAGIGMRAFFDLWLLCQSEKKDPESRARLLQRCGFEKFSLICEELADHWLGGGELTGLGESFERFIINCSTYGSEKNRILLDQDEKGGRFGYIWSRIFMPYDQIKYAYPILQKYRWLTFACQIARWCKLLSRKMAKKAINELQISRSIDSKDSKELKKFLCEIGIKGN